jgi:hypothetical protein
MTDAEALDKARKLKALADNGATEGERAAARNVLGKFLTRYPAIGPMLDAPAAAPPPPPPSNVDGAFGGFPSWRTPPPRPGGGFRPSGMAEPPKPAAGGFMGSVWDFLQGAAQSLREGMTLRERVKDVTAVDVTANTRTFTMRLTIPIRDLEELLDDGPERDEEVATILASIVRQEFLNVLASMDSDDGDE